MPRSPYQGPLIERPCPPPPKGPVIKILRPAPGESVQAVCLSDRITGFEIHYRNCLSIPCCGVPTKCPGCVQGMPSRWYGYIIVLQQPQHKLWLYEVTEGAWNTGVACKAFDGDLRGRGVKVARDRKSKRGRINLTFTQSKVGYDLPECPDIRAVLARIWGIDPHRASEEEEEPPPPPPWFNARSHRPEMN